MSLVACRICVKWHLCADKYIKMCIYAHILYYAHVCMGMAHTSECACISVHV